MFGIRTALKPDLECSAAELVYGTTLRIPGDFFGYSQRSADLDPSDYVQRLRQVMTHLRGTPPRAPTSLDSTVFTDHKPLTFALRSQSGKHLDYISQFTTDIRHIDGTRNEVADMLSRASLSSLQLSHGIDLGAMAAE
ncbi:hypothetical protein SprV_0200598800 [Sparganum proliferum]